MDQPRTPKSHKNDPDEELVSLIIQLRLGLMYGENQFKFILERDYGVIISVHGVHNILSRAGLLEKRKKKVRKDRRLFCEEDCLDCNTYRPHSMLDNITPVEFLQSLEGYKNACPDFSVLY